MDRINERAQTTNHTLAFLPSRQFSEKEKRRPAKMVTINGAKRSNAVLSSKESAVGCTKPPTMLTTKAPIDRSIARCFLVSLAQSFS